MKHDIRWLRTERLLSPSFAARIAKGLGPSLAVVLVSVSGLVGCHVDADAAGSAPPPSVAVATPIQTNLAPRLSFLGQFSPVEKVELRAQVGGTLTEIHFKDGDFVKKGDLLFVIDSAPYDIKLSQATAQLEGANARLELATRELQRAQTLKNSDAGSAENVEQRNAEKLAAQAAVDGAKALVRDARFDLDHTRIVAPFSGRIGTHLVSVGNLIAGSRAGSGLSTLLTTLVSLNPIYLDFDMSEADYMTFLRERTKVGGPLANQVEVSLTDEAKFPRKGTLDFVDNALDRSSGTIHARATVPNNDLLLTPGSFGRLRLSIAKSASTLLVPDASVLADQSGHGVLTVGPDNVVKAKSVEVGELRGGLRVVRSGLLPTDKVVIDGIPSAAPGAKVAPHAGTIQFGADQD